MTFPYCTTADSVFGNRTTRESDAGASVGFSPWSAILFPVTFTLLRDLNLDGFFSIVLINNCLGGGGEH